MSSAWRLGGSKNQRAIGESDSWPVTRVGVVYNTSVATPLAKALPLMVWNHERERQEVQPTVTVLLCSIATELPEP